MDKIIWLSVIREELGLLNSLATGMIDDASLTREEVMLAISRSKIVVHEFEMLLNNLPTPENQVVSEDNSEPKAKTEPVVAAEPVVVVIPDAEEKILPTEERKEFIQQEQPEDSPRPTVSKSPSPKVAPSPPLPVASSPPPYFSDTESVEIPVYSLEEKKEESTPYKAAPIKSMREGLSLNDRYLFQRELFNNDKSRLDESVAALDRLTNIHEAVEYLKANFRWTKSEASEKFVQLVKRRFSN